MPDTPVLATVTGRGRPRLAVVISHPIQHFCPQYASWAESEAFELRVFFASRAGLDAYQDRLFGTTVKWEGLRVDTFPHAFLAGSEARQPTTDLDAPDLDDELDRFDPDAVLVYGYGQRLQRRAFNWARRRQRRIIYFADSELRQARRLSTRALKQVVLRRYFRDVDVFATVGDANEEYYRAYGARMEQFVRMPLPIDVAAYEVAWQSAAEQRDALRQQYEIAPDDFVVCMAGKFVPWKRQADLIRMLGHLPITSRRIVVLLMGTGQDEAALRALAATEQRHRVVFTGFVQPARLPAHYAASDAYVHTAEREPHSLAVSEALYLGRPIVISSRCGSYGPSDDVQVGRNGFVYPCGDTEALAACVRQLMEVPGLWQRMAEASREYGVRAQRLAHHVGIEAALQAAGLHLPAPVVKPMARSLPA